MKTQSTSKTSLYRSLALALLGLATTVSAQWNASQDLITNELNASTELNNPNGAWSYGHRSAIAGTTLNLFQASEHSNNINGSSALQGYQKPTFDGTPHVYAHTGNAVVNLGATVLPMSPGLMVVHPAGPGLPDSVVVVRWKTPAAGIYNITANWGSQTNNGGGAKAAIVINGAVSYSASWGPNGGASKVLANLALAANATVDFAVAPGTDNFSDWVAFNATVAPATLIPTTAQGRYLGIIAPGPLNSQAGGRLDISTTSSTNATGSVRFVNQTLLPLTMVPGSIALSGGVLTGTLTTAASVVPPLTVNFSINVNRMTATIIRDPSGTTPISGNAEGWKQTACSYGSGLHNFILPSVSSVNPATEPQGVGFGSFSITPSTGAYAISGRTACNEPFTCSAFTGPDATAHNIALFAFQAGKFSLSGTWQLDPTTTPTANLFVPGPSSITYQRPINPTTTYPQGFQMSVDAVGGKYVANPLLMATILGTPMSAPLSFTCVGLPAAYNPNRNVAFVNVLTSSPNAWVTASTGGLAKTAFGVNHSTGKTMSGASCQFILKDNEGFPYYTPNVVRTVQFSGLAIPTATAPGVKIAGNYLLKQLTSSQSQPTLTYSGLFNF